MRDNAEAIAYPKIGHLLFDLQNDPNEMTNLIDVLEPRVARLQADAGLAGEGGRQVQIPTVRHPNEST